VTTIRASCPTCGDVELTVRDVSVHVCAADNRGSYAFLCPTCRFAVSKEAEPRIVDMLVSAGVRVQVWHVPAEMAEPRSGAPIGYDDLLDFHEMLQVDGWFNRLAEMVEKA
jgi:hypothetical protein